MVRPFFPFELRGKYIVWGKIDFFIFTGTIDIPCSERDINSKKLKKKRITATFLQRMSYQSGTAFSISALNMLFVSSLSLYKPLISKRTILFFFFFPPLRKACLSLFLSLFVWKQFVLLLCQQSFFVSWILRVDNSETVGIQLTKHFIMLEA